MSTNGRADLIRIAGPLVLGIGLLAWALRAWGSTAFFTPAPMRWSGGKRLMVKRLVEKIPPHKVYVEPFIGAGHIFWAKDPAEKEVINDIDRHLIEYYRYLRDSPRFGCDLRRAERSGIGCGNATITGKADWTRASGSTR